MFGIIAIGDGSRAGEHLLQHLPAGQIAGPASDTAPIGLVRKIGPGDGVDIIVIDPEFGAGDGIKDRQSAIIAIEIAAQRVDTGICGNRLFQAGMEQLAANLPGIGNGIRLLAAIGFQGNRERAVASGRIIGGVIVRKGG